MAPLRILVVTNMYPPHHLGGYELSCRDVVERWQARGHTVEVLTTTMRVPSARHCPEGTAPVRRELGFYWKNYRRVDRSLAGKFRMERRNQKALRRAVADVRPDVVSVWHMGAMSLGLLQTIAELHIPMVLVVCDEWLVYGPEADLWMQSFANRPRLGSAVRRVTALPTSLSLGPEHTTICFVSDWIRRKAQSESSVPLGRTTVVYSGIDLHDFPLADQPDKAWSWRLLCVGRVEERKGVHVVIEALARLPNGATLEVIGPAHFSYMQQLRRSAEALGVGDRVTFVGSVERAQLREHYRSADAFVFPVLWDEPFGLVPLEAMACGTPVIATGTGGSAEFLVDGVNSLVVPPGDADALAAAVLRLADDDARRRSLIHSGSRTAGLLDVDTLADVLETWHVAAAGGFSEGVPPDRPRIGELLRGSPGRGG